MKKNIFPILITVLVMLSTNTYADEQEKNLKELPAILKKSFKKIKHDRITEIEKEIEDGEVEYEVDYIADGVAYEATFDSSGKLLKIEEDDHEIIDEDEPEDKK